MGQPDPFCGAGRLSAITDVAAAITREAVQKRSGFIGLDEIGGKEEKFAVIGGFG